MGLLDRLKKQEPIESEYTLEKEELSKTEYKSVDDTSERGQMAQKDYHVVGTEYHIDSFKKLAKKNPEWGKAIPKETEGNNQQIYRYNYISKPCELVGRMTMYMTTMLSRL